MKEIILMIIVMIPMVIFVLAHIVLPIIGLINILYRIFTEYWNPTCSRILKYDLAFLGSCYALLWYMQKMLDKQQEADRQERYIKAVENSMKMV